MILDNQGIVKNNNMGEIISKGLTNPVVKYFCTRKRNQSNELCASNNDVSSFFLKCNFAI